MKLGFLTACLPQVGFEDLVAWASDEGFDAIELAAWPQGTGRENVAGQLDVVRMGEEMANWAKDLLAAHDLEISAMAYYENNLHPEEGRQAEHVNHLRRVIDAASALDVGLVGTFVGAQATKPPEVIKKAGTLFRDLCSYAEDRGVRLMIENCPMENWLQWGLPGNYAYSPELWDALFNEVPDLGLNFDPSHLYWLQIDHNRAARDYADRIFHAHAKDAETMPEGKYRYGVLAEQLGGNAWRSGWWRYRMPGSGGIDWGEFVGTLKEIGYDDVLSIEHEDPEFEGDEAKIKEGLRLGRRHLEQYV